MNSSVAKIYYGTHTSSAYIYKTANSKALNSCNISCSIFKRSNQNSSQDYRKTRKEMKKERW